jgi:PPK2 family polyphosphate:nucleotide phosphotransferase
MPAGRGPAVAERTGTGGRRAGGGRTAGRAATSTAGGGGRGRARTGRAAATAPAKPAQAKTTQAKAARTTPAKAAEATAAKAAKAAAADPVAAQARVTRPERLVVADPPPEPDYPRWRVEPGTPLRLADVDPDDSEHYRRKKDVTDELAHHRDRISDLQARLYGEHRRSLLIVLQAMDTGGKDGTIKGVFAGVNPQGCQVWSFKAPSNEEADHDFLWRYHHKVPAKGMIHIFNRSHYEDVLVVRVKELVPEAVWRPRYAAINQFEEALSASGVTVLKFFLHISKDEQKRRLERRLQDPDKRWKFSANDLKERAWWDDYQAAFEDAVNQCSTPFAPWYCIPANKKWYRNLVVARTIADTLEAMDPRYPPAEQGLDQVEIPD